MMRNVSQQGWLYGAGGRGVSALFGALLLLALATAPAPLRAENGFAALLEVEGPIGPATHDYLSRAMDQAVADGARLVIIRLDTPGGLASSMRDIIKQILSAPIPVVGYVHPSGAHAASAGTYILYATHIAAMSPATNLGAATPVQLSPPGGTPQPPGTEATKQPPAEDARERKAVNDAVAYIRGLAELRGRNADWAESAVREAASLEADAALEMGVIDLIAESPEQLLARIDGRTVSVGEKEVTLASEGLPLRSIEPDWRNRLLAVITNPNVAYILLLIGIYGLILEFANPGTIVAGVVGAICLLIALFALQALPINYAGLGLILLGMALMVGEAFVPSFGALGIGGVIAFVIGSIMLMDTDAPGFGIDIALIGGFALFSALLFIFVLGMVLQARRRPVVSGAEELIGAEGAVVGVGERGARVRLHGELWQARSNHPLHKGQRIRVTQLDGLTLEVTPVEEQGDNGG